MIKSNKYHMVAGKYQVWNFQWNPKGSDSVFSGCVEQLAWRVLEILRTVYFFINVRWLYPATSKCTFFLPTLWLSFLCFSWLDFLGMPGKIGQKACRGGMCGWGGIGGEINIAEICTARNNRLMSTGTVLHTWLFWWRAAFFGKRHHSTPTCTWYISTWQQALNI